MVTIEILWVELAKKDDGNPVWVLRTSSMRLSALPKTNFCPKPPPLSWIMASEEVIEEVEALTAILEEDTVEVVKEEGGERPKVKLD